MSVIDLMKKRCSVRSYTDTPVEQEKLEQVLEAGRIAPSACNLQPWRFVLVQDKEMLEKVYSCYGRDWIRQAQAVIVILGVHEEAWKRTDGKDHCDIDVAIAVDHMTLQAAELELGTCWICMFDVEKMKKLFDIPVGVEPIALLPIGYPAKTAPVDRHETARKAFTEVAFKDSFDIKK